MASTNGTPEEGEVCAVAGSSVTTLEITEDVRAAMSTASSPTRAAGEDAAGEAGTLSVADSEAADVGSPGPQTEAKGALALADSLGEPAEDNLPPARDMRENILEPAIAELTAPNVADVDKPTKIEDFRPLASYTWVKGQHPTIIVPGSPREWLDSPMPFTVDFDSGIRMFHEDAYYMANQSTLVPLFRAVDALASSVSSGPDVDSNKDMIDWAAIDFVTDRNNLRKLLRWMREPFPSDAAQPLSPVSEPSLERPTRDQGERKEGSAATTAPEWDTRKDFRIDLQLGGADTVLMHRWAARAREVAVPPKAGCRLNFEREATKAAQGCENGAGHYRIVQYTICGLKMVVRFEVDACVATSTHVTPPHTDGDETRTEDSARELSERASGSIPVAPTEKVAGIQARQSFTNEDEANMWVVGSAAEDWGFTEAPTQKGKQTSGDDRGQALPPAETGWELPADDATAWGVAPDAAQNADLPIIPGELAVVRAGTLLPQSSIIELATRSIMFADRTSNEDTFLQLFLSQTPTHLLAIHTNGTFEKVLRQGLDSPEFTGIEEMESIQKCIAQFVALLKEIHRLVKEHGTTRRLSLVCEKGKLELFGLKGEEGRLAGGDLERFKATA
ncbi:hypothetical protein BD311DRAFT_700940 [Dichomitus squalens]|uniref:Uncharacterized protein n=1 Tax=Dichomitus squalens TaxID=114155 RepID=A0A4Q9MGV8_9APHY|nr:hypothetical protein BD311DRAFT_700940 [Dichomitus squalens]